MTFAALRVVELAGSPAGGWAAKLFAGLGASVTKVVPEGGDPVGARAPAMAAYLDAGKRVLTTDDDGLADLIASADVLVESAGPLPLTADPRDRHPLLVHLRLSPFGTSGPYAGYRGGSLIEEAWSGHAYLNGDPAREPIGGPGHQSDYAAGGLGFAGAMAALFARLRTGEGDVVEVSHLEAMVALHQFTFVKYTHGGQILRRMGNRYAGPGNPIGSYECADGNISISAPNGPMARAVLRAIGSEDLLDGRRIAELMVDGQEIDDRLRPWLRERLVDDAVRLLQGAGVPAAPNRTMLELLDDEHFRERGVWIDVDGLTHPGPPFRIGRHPWTLRPTTAAAGTSPGTGASAGEKAAPLDGVRVLDLTKVWAGPLAARILAELGADVVMVEAPMARGPRQMPPDLARSMALFPENEPAPEPWNRNGFQNEYARNKRSVALDLREEEGRAVLERLAAGADVLMENYSARVMPGFGLDDDRLHEINPGLVYVTMPGYGRTGPCRDWLAFGNVIDGHAGMTSLTGYADGPPWKSGMAWPDAVAGVHAAAATLVALYDREHDPERRGDTIEVAQVETVIAALGHELLDAQLRGHDRGPRGNGDPVVAPQGVYPCRGEDRWIAISVLDDAGWEALSAVAGIDPSLARLDVRGRRERRIEIDAALAEFTAAQDHADLAHRLQALGVAAAPVLDAPGVLEDPHLSALGFFVVVDHPVAGSHRANRLPIRFARTPVVPPAPAPRFGADNEAVLTDAGFGADDVAGLAARGVIVDAPPR